MPGRSRGEVLLRTSRDFVARRDDSHMVLVQFFRPDAQQDEVEFAALLPSPEAVVLAQMLLSSAMPADMPTLYHDPIVRMLLDQLERRSAAIRMLLDEMGSPAVFADRFPDLVSILEES